MTRDQQDTNERPAVAVEAGAGAAPTSYPLRQFITYQRLIERGERLDPEQVLADYVKANPDADLEAPYTFAQWWAGSAEPR